MESVDFRDVPGDVVGRIFQRLISPDERHRFGQHFTGDDPVDLINSFCIRDGATTVLDPACGSGSFLVRAYYRKRYLEPSRQHLDLIAELFGCDIAVYPAHLSTLNLAAREINDEANYPRIARSNFFDIIPKKPFCHVPDIATHELQPIRLSTVGAVVGNPPYVRQEKIGKAEKPRIASLIANEWNGLRLSGRSDVHCYFWPHAAYLLPDGQYFGFLTSAQWLDVDYGFDLQRWILQNFKIIAIMESAEERWFPDARVKTCITILQRCENAAERDPHLVRFVRFEKPLMELFGVISTGGVGDEAIESERRRQQAVDRIRDIIESTMNDVHTDDWRIMVKTQRELWLEGVQAAAALEDAEAEPTFADQHEDDESDDDDEGEGGGAVVDVTRGEYTAGKWGRYLRAPDLYFDVMRRFADRFVTLGEIVNIRRGITSGCDKFFMPWDVTDELLASIDDDREFRRTTGVSRRELRQKRLRIIQDGAGMHHPIEQKYIAPEVHSLMKVDRPVVRTNDLHRVVLLIDEPLNKLKGTYAYKYLRYGEKQTFESRKSRSVPVPERSTCVARDLWYDLTGAVKPAFAFWPKGSQYRHLVIWNPDQNIGNCRLNCLTQKTSVDYDPEVLTAILNSTLVALWRNYYGRYTGSEGALELMVLDVNLIDVPTPCDPPSDVAEKLITAFRSICEREPGPLCEPELLSCHSYERARRLAERPVVLSAELQQKDRRELDDAVFELLGVSDPPERSRYVDALHEETAKHFRAIRVVEIQKMEDRAKGGRRRFTASDLAADAWDAVELDDLMPLAKWVEKHATGSCEEIEIPSARPAHLEADGMFDTETVYFGRKREWHLECSSRGQAELVKRLADLGVTDAVYVPKNMADAVQLLDRVNHRHEKAMARLRELAESRTSDEDTYEQVAKVLERWFVQGRPKVNGNTEKS